MPLLIFDKSVPLSEQRLRVALSKCVRRKGKKHATGKRNHVLRAAKKMAAKAKIAKRNRATWTFNAAVSAYWNGERDEHPGAPK